jgi:AraC family transcriptional regulator of adaptative response/methylated-DNA-[protein]-cysteine methyltransferase
MDPTTEDRSATELTAVRTTGIFCQAGCPARPLPQNTERFATPWEALAAGYRPCRRCWPMGRPDQLPAGTRLLTITRFRTPLGPMVAAAVDDGVAVLDFADRRALRTELRDACRRLRATPTVISPRAAAEHPHLGPLLSQMTEYFAGRRTRFDLALEPHGTPFEASVWSWLRTIPPGETRTYAQGAAAVGRPAAVRATGRANGRNPIAIVVPCHRVIGSDGDLTGYGGGLWRKQALLDLEAAAYRSNPGAGVSPRGNIGRRTAGRELKERLRPGATGHLLRGVAQVAGERV